MVAKELQDMTDEDIKNTELFKCFQGFIKRVEESLRKDLLSEDLQVMLIDEDNDIEDKLDGY